MSELCLVLDHDAQPIHVAARREGEFEKQKEEQRLKQRLTLAPCLGIPGTLGVVSLPGRLPFFNVQGERERKIWTCTNSAKDLDDGAVATTCRYKSGNSATPLPKSRNII